MTIRKGGYAAVKAPTVWGKVVKTGWDDNANGGEGGRTALLRWKDQKTGEIHAAWIPADSLEERDAPPEAAELENLPEDVPAKNDSNEQEP